MSQAELHPLEACLEDALRLPPQWRTTYVEDVRWLFQQRLWDWLQAQGLPVRRQYVSVLRINQGQAFRFPGHPLAYTCTTGRRAIIDAKFCFPYGFEEHSTGAINYRHPCKEVHSPADFVSAGPLSLGSFAVVLERLPVAVVPALPGALRCCGRVETRLNKSWSVQAWLGVWFNAQALPAPALARLRALTQSVCPPPKLKMCVYEYSKFMLHYGQPSDDEDELRERLGFAPKGKPVSEEILYRSVCEIFGADAVRRRYRGRELQGLELDVWVPALRLGFEYQGEQHERKVAHWHGEDGLERQQQRDKRKKVLCKKLGYRLVYFYPNDWLDRVSVLRRLRQIDALPMPCQWLTCAGHISAR